MPATSTAGWGCSSRDVDCGKRGREALRTFIDPAVRTFYRSIHFICGHVIDFVDDDTAIATGTVYCRAEHEDGAGWVVMAIVYHDHYARREGVWYFERRSEKHWYSADTLRRPASPFQLWDRWPNQTPHLPTDFPTWKTFWAKSSDENIAQLTAQPVPR